MTSTVLILGAAGRIGAALAAAFADAGWTVRAQARKPLPAALAAHPRVQPVRCEALDADALRAAARGAHVVVHALNPPYTQWDALALPLADAAITAARDADALLMLPGNVYNFGRELPPVLTPRTPECGNTPKARIRIGIESRIAARPGLRSAVIRAGDFFGGAGRGAWFDLCLTRGLAKGRFVYPGDDLDVVHAWAYLPDLAQAFVHVAARHADWRGHRRLHFAGHAVTGREMQQAMERAVGRPLRAGRLPWGVLRAGAWWVPDWREMVAMRYLWQRPHRLEDGDGGDGDTLRSLAGDLPVTPLDDAVRAALGDLGLLPQSSASPAPASFNASARA